VKRALAVILERQPTFVSNLTGSFGKRKIYGVSACPPTSALTTAHDETPIGAGFSFGA
jgi:hypothetical protein